MPLTNAQKQARFAARRKAKLERLAVLEGAMREIAEGYHETMNPKGWRVLAGHYDPAAIARKALGDVG